LITNLEIERFKSIRSVSIELGRVNIFIGGNGSGKSNLLEAIGVLSSALNRGLSDTDFKRKGVRITPPALMKSAFKKLDLPKTFTLRARATGDIEYYCTLTSSSSETSLSFSHESCTKAGQKLFGRSPKGASALGIGLKRNLDRYRGVWDQTKAIFEFDDETVAEIDKIARYAIYAPQTEFLRGRRIGAVDTPPIGLHGEGLPSAVRTFLTDLNKLTRKQSAVSAAERDLVSNATQLPFSPGWASSFQAGKISELMRSSDMELSNQDMVYFVDRFMHSKRNKLSVYDSSEGTLFLLFAAVLIAHKEAPPIFAMDNVDSALNPRLTRLLLDHIIQAAKSRQNNQLTRVVAQNRFFSLVTTQHHWMHSIFSTTTPAFLLSLGSMTVRLV
jgi:energy-coupling factor transporter ATP-binding protein EcfA2